MPSGRLNGGWMQQVLVHVVYPKLNPVSQAYLATYMPGLSPVEPLGAIVSELGFQNYLRVDQDGLDLTVLEFFSRWREDNNLSIFLDTCFLAGIPTATIREDIRLMWNITVTAEDLVIYSELFIDRDLLRTGWDGYEKAYGDQRAGFIRLLMRQPHDYVRWKLGVPVSLETELVLDRLISESYYAERSIKSEMGGATPSRDQLARIKMERDTMFKVIDRRLKLAEAKKGGGDDGENVAQAALDTLARMTLKYEKNDFPTVEELTGAPVQAYDKPPNSTEQPDPAPTPA